MDPGVLSSIPLSLLKAFEAAGRNGSFRAAAAELNLSASAVSHAVRKLESALGTKLFLRSARAVRLSPEGHALLDAVGRGFSEIRSGLEAVATRQPGLLRLHCAPSFAAQYLMPRLRSLLHDQPSVDLRLAASTSYVEFPSDEFDADIVYGEPKTHGLIAHSLGEETVSPMCAPALAKLIRGIDDLAAHPLIQSDNKLIRWTDWYRANGHAAPRAQGRSQGPRFDRSFMAIAAAVDGLGIALESTMLAERELADGRLVRPLSGHATDPVYRGHWLVYSDASAKRRAITTFETWLHGHLKETGKAAQ